MLRLFISSSLARTNQKIKTKGKKWIPAFAGMTNQGESHIFP